MTNKEQIQRDIAVAFDFAEHIIDNPEILDKIPEGSSVTFIDEENVKPEKLRDEKTAKKYIRVKRQFEVM